MKIAFIMLCHKNAEQINRLLNRLEEFNCEIFIHIDKKSKNIREEIKQKNNIHILPQEQSYDIKWGGIDMVLSTLALLKAVTNYSKEKKVKFDYVWLLSGQDYIIQKTENIINNMKKNTNINYLEVIPKDTKRYNKYLKLYEVAYPSWITKNNNLIKIIKRLYMLLTGGFYRTISCFKRKKPFTGDFYFGSQWWTLTYECAEYIIDYCNRNPNYIEYFKKSIIPDECFFQTIIMNSKYKDSVKNNLTYVNWGKNRRSPETITGNDINLIKSVNNKYYFARKFDLKIDKRIIEKIDKNLK